MFARASTARYWINTGDWAKRADALQEDSRYRKFAAYRERGMYNNNRRLNAQGGNDFWESGLLSPQLILADLIHIFHPGLLPGHQPVFYTRLP